MSKKNKKGFYDYLETLSKNGSGIAKVGSGLLIGAVYKALFDKFKKNKQNNPQKPTNSSEFFKYVSIIQYKKSAE